MAESIDFSEVLNLLENEDDLLEYLQEETNLEFDNKLTNYVDINEFLEHIEAAFDLGILSGEEYRRIELIIGVAIESGHDFVDLNS